MLGGWALIVLLIVTALPVTTALGRVSQREAMRMGQNESAPVQEESDPAGNSSEISELWGESRTTSRAVRRMSGRFRAAETRAPGLAGRHALRGLSMQVCAYDSHNGLGGPLMC